LLVTLASASSRPYHTRTGNGRGQALSCRRDLRRSRVRLCILQVYYPIATSMSAPSYLNVPRSFRGYGKEIKLILTTVWNHPHDLFLVSNILLLQNVSSYLALGIYCRRASCIPKCWQSKPWIVLIFEQTPRCDVEEIVIDVSVKFTSRGNFLSQ
jgi:hypothetical protein